MGKRGIWVNMQRYLQHLRGFLPRFGPGVLLLLSAEHPPLPAASTLARVNPVEVSIAPTRGRESYYTQSFLTPLHFVFWLLLFCVTLPSTLFLLQLLRMFSKNACLSHSASLISVGFKCLVHSLIHSFKMTYMYTHTHSC